MSLRLTIVGSAGTNPSAERVCSCYLVEADGFRLVLDLGHGALHRLQQVIDVAEIDALLLSHLHADHFADIYGLNYAMRFHPAAPPPIPVYTPPGGEAFITQLLPEESIERMGASLTFHEARPGTTLECGPLTIELHRANHPVETLASRITDGTRTLTYTGDTAPSDEVVAAATGADLLLCDATWLESQRPLPADVHCTGREAGQIADRAGVSRLVVTHVSPYNDPAAVAAEAAEVFAGEVVIAHDLQEITL